MTLDHEFSILPLDAQVFVVDASPDNEYPQFETGEEAVVANAYGVVLATKSDPDGPVSVRIRRSVRVAGADRDGSMSGRVAPLSCSALSRSAHALRSPATAGISSTRAVTSGSSPARSRRASGAPPIRCTSNRLSAALSSLQVSLTRFREALSVRLT